MSKKIIARADGTTLKMPSVHFDCPFCGTAWCASFEDSYIQGYEWSTDEKTKEITTYSCCPVCNECAVTKFDTDYFRSAMQNNTEDDLVAPTEDEK